MAAFAFDVTLSVIAARCQIPPFVAARHLPPAGGSLSSQGELNSLSQNLTVLPAPSGREPLARPQAFHFSRKRYRYAKGPILEGAVCVADWGSSGKLPLPSCRFASSHLPQGDGFRGGGKVSGIAQRRPLGGAGCERSEQTEGVSAARLLPQETSAAAAVSRCVPSRENAFGALRRARQTRNIK